MEVTNIMSDPRNGKLGTLNEEEEDDDNDETISKTRMQSRSAMQYK